MDSGEDGESELGRMEERERKKNGRRGKERLESWGEEERGRREYQAVELASTSSPSSPYSV